MSIVKMHFDENELAKLMQLCRIHCTDEEKKKFLGNLSSIIAYMEQLQEVDTDHVEPVSHVVETLANVFREDAIGEVLPRETFLANAPSQVGGMIRVPPVIKPGP